jgi:hypothetical protein
VQHDPGTPAACWCNFTSRLFEDKRRDVQVFDFQQLQTEINEHLPDASKTIDAIEVDFKRKTGPLVEELLKKTLFFFLKAAQKKAKRAKQDSLKSDVEI